MATAPATGLLPEVAAFLGESPLGAVIGGREVSWPTGQCSPPAIPAPARSLAEVSAMQPDDVDRAVQAAAEAFADLRLAALSPNERGVLLHRLADAVEKRKTIIAQIEALDCGKILAQAEGDVQNFVDTLRYYTNLALHVQRRSAAGRRRPRGLDRAPALGAVRLHLPLELPHPADRLEHLARPWPPATRWSSSRPRTRRCRRSTWPGWPRRSAFPTA